MSPIVPIDSVEPDRETHKRDVDKERARLIREGQIEPLSVLRTENEGYRISGENWYDSTTLAAARELGWTSVIVAVRRRK